MTATTQPEATPGPTPTDPFDDVAGPEPSPTPTREPTPTPDLERLVEIVMEPGSSLASPIGLQPGEVVDFTVRVLTNGQEVTGVTISMTFDPRFLLVVDSDDMTFGDQIDGLPPLDLVVENVADNDAGTIRYTAGTTSTGPSTAFDLALVSFEALDVETPPGMPTEVVFVVGAHDTGASSAGKQLLREKSDFTGAWIAVGP